MSSEGALIYLALRRRWMSLLFYLVGLKIISRKQSMATDRVHPFASFRRMMNVSLIPSESFTAGSGYFQLSLHLFVKARLAIRHWSLCSPTRDIFVIFKHWTWHPELACQTRLCCVFKPRRTHAFFSPRHLVRASHLLQTGDLWIEHD